MSFESTMETLRGFGLIPMEFDTLNNISKMKVNQNFLESLKRLYNSGMIVGHKDFDILLKEYEEGKKFYIYTGRGPSSGSLHMGHMIPFITAKYLQDIFDVPVFIQLSTDEKYLRDGLTLEKVEEMARSNAADIMSLGFNPDKTIILSNFDSIKQLYPMTMDILRHVTIQHMSHIFGISPQDYCGNLYFPAVEIAPAFPRALTNIISDCSRSLVLLGLDQDPYFRLARDLAGSLKQNKPSMIYTYFVPALNNVDIKMSSSDEKYAIFLSDTKNIVNTKIKKFAFSGGKETLELQKKLGADINVDVSCKYLKILSSFKEINCDQIIEEYRTGKLMSGTFKSIVITHLSEILDDFRKNRVSDEILDTVMTLRKIC